VGGQERESEVGRLSACLEAANAAAVAADAESGALRARTAELEEVQGAHAALCEAHAAAEGRISLLEAQCMVRAAARAIKRAFRGVLRCVDGF
jgi:hypothetical protein